MNGVTIATITLARNAPEERTILKALAALEGFPIITADGGSRPRFIAGLHKLGLQIICPREKGLVVQVKASIRAALDASDSPFILYTEPDKLPFFRGAMQTFLRRGVAQKKVAVTFAARNRRGFNSFPQGQRRCEEMMNLTTGLLLGSTGDYCYGPILLNRSAALLALEAPENLGWGWRFWLLGRAARKKWKFSTIELPVACPKEQRDENSAQDQLYRVKQLRQNLDGVFLGYAE